MCPLNNRKAFTLVEVIVILAVIAILAAIAIPVALRIFQVTAEEATRDEMNNLKMAMIGNPKKLQSTMRSDFGFLGDMGRIPANLDELLVKGSLPAFTFDNAKQAGAGWNGPYITGAAAGEAPEDFKKDQLGNSYTYSDADFTNADGQLADGKITSAGPDGVFGTADDIVLEILKNETSATVRGSVKNTSGVGLRDVAVEFYSAVNGTLTTTTATTDANGNYSFSSAPFGPRAAKPNPTGLVLVPNSVTVSGGGNRNVNFQVANYSGSSITVDRITVNCAGTGAVRYDDVRVNDGGADLTPANNNLCSPATQIDITNVTIAANSTPPASLRVVVDSADTQLPDLVLRGGKTITWNIERFEDAGGGIVDMSGGKTITVTFYSDATTAISTVTVVTP